MTYSYLSNSPVLDIRKFVIQEIHKTDILDGIEYPTDFDQKIPVVPIQQQPETNTIISSEKPFLVYTLNLINKGDDTDFWIKSEEVTFMIYCSSYLITLAIQDFLVDLFGRYDKSADDINAISETDNTIKYIMCSGSTNFNPSESEGGRYGGSVSFEFDYVKQISDSGRFAI